MKKLTGLMLWGLIAISRSVLAATPEEEIQRLLQYVRESNVTFIRNQQEYSSSEAADHMQKKREHFKAEIKSAEDFIRLAGTKSLMSGEPYVVKTADGQRLDSSPWLQAELDRFRAQSKSRQGSPRMAPR